MKRILKFMVLLITLFLVYQFIILLFVKEHHLDYTIQTEKGKYTVKETFSKEGKDSIYSFEMIGPKNKSYHFQAYEDYNKQEKIIEKIELYEQGETTCIYPVLKGNRQSEIICRQGNQEVSLSYLLLSDKNITTFLNNLTKKGYQSTVWNLENEKKVHKQFTYYQDNIDENQAVYFWNYRGVYVITGKEDLTSKDLFEVDKYENNQSILVGSNYLTIDSDQKYDFDTIFLIKSFYPGVDTITLKDKISQDSYFCGAVDDLAYLIDRKNKKQYEVNPKSRSVRLIGDVSLNAQYYDGKTWSTRNIYDFINQDTYFGISVSSKLQQKYPEYTIYPGKGRTYLVKGNAVYYISDIYQDSPILLFELEDLKEIKVKENQVFAISKDTVYKYSIEKGLRPIMTSREILFNSKNIYEVAFKS